MMRLPLVLVLASVRFQLVTTDSSAAQCTRDPNTVDRSFELAENKAVRLSGLSLLQVGNNGFAKRHVVTADRADILVGEAAVALASSAFSSSEDDEVPEMLRLSQRKITAGSTRVQRREKLPLVGEIAELFSIFESDQHGSPDPADGSASSDEGDSSEEPESPVKDEGDWEIAQSVENAPADSEALDGDNQTLKEALKDEVDDAIESGVEDSKWHDALSDRIPTVANDTGENVSAKSEIKEEVDDAVEKTVRKAIGDEAKPSEADSTEAVSPGPTLEPTPALTSSSRQAGEIVDFDTAANETGEKVVEKIKEKITDAIDEQVRKAVVDEHRDPTEQELKEAASEEIDRIWDILSDAKRHKPSHRRPDQSFGINEFFHSVAVFDWFLLFVTFVISLGIYRHMLNWPSEKSYHGVSLLIWFAVGALYNALIFLRQGRNDGIMWMNGYILEVIFLVENVFVFHFIVKAFNLPRLVTQKVMFIVVAVQIVFQMVFYMGLAATLRQVDVLPYIVGPWLIYCGYQACVEDDDHGFNILDSWLVTSFRSCCGDRLAMDEKESETGDIIVNRKGVKCLSTVGLAAFCVLIADFLLEIDVTLTKIESIPNPYLCFSSSVLATFTVPELFFVARDLFKKFFALKYAIGFVLVFFGAQMCLHSVVTISALTSITVIVCVLLTSIVASIVLGLGGGYAAPPLDVVEDQGAQRSDPCASQ